MATILEELEALVGKDAAAKIAAKSDVAKRLQEGERLYRFYTGEEGDDDQDDAAERARVEQAEKDRKAMADKAEADRQAAAARNNGTPDNKSILAELTTLLDSKLDALKKDFIPASKLPEYEGQILSKALKTSHELSRIESTHEKEFGESLDLTKFDEYVNEQKKSGANWPSISAAYNNWVSEKRIEARVKKEVEEAKKQFTSSQSVPAQTHTASMSPAQQIIADAKKTTGDGNGKTRAMEAAERLAQLERAREGAAA